MLQQLSAEVAHETTRHRVGRRCNSLASSVIDGFGNSLVLTLNDFISVVSVVIDIMLSVVIKQIKYRNKASGLLLREMRIKMQPRRASKIEATRKLQTVAAGQLCIGGGNN